MNKRKIIIDCDPGHDDAVALMLALKSPKLDVLGITTENGNQTIEKTSKNALDLIEYLGFNVPTCRGLSHPIKREPIICSEIHGESGLDGVILPPHKGSFVTKDVVTFLKDLLLSNEKVTIVTTGAMTNIGTLLSKHPEVKPHIEEIVSMGGSIGFGNVTPAAEFNILCDPEAADIVFNSGLIVKMIGLDVTRQVLVLPNVIERMKKINNYVSTLFVDLMIAFNKTQKEVFGLPGGPLHDPATIVALLDESVIHFDYMNVVIDVSGGPSYGRTNCDQFNFLKQNPNVYVATKIDVNKYWDNIEKGLKAYS